MWPFDKKEDKTIEYPKKEPMETFELGTCRIIEEKGKIYPQIFTNYMENSTSTWMYVVEYETLFGWYRYANPPFYFTSQEYATVEECRALLKRLQNLYRPTIVDGKVKKEQPSTAKIEAIKEVISK